MTRSLFDDAPPFEDDHRGRRAERPGAASEPLAERLRPRSLDEVVGQDALVGGEGFLRRAIEDDRLPSFVLWGPPGCGKTTLARLVAAATEHRFVPFSAVTSGIKEVKAVMADAARMVRAQGRRTLLFVDEIHRFNRAQQDAFLPYLETGDIVLVGATTENPSFALNAALMSRCRVAVLEPLATDAVLTILRRALADDERGLAGSGVEVADGALAAIAQLASGDARRALNQLELAVADCLARGGEVLDAEGVRGVSQRKVLVYDRSGEEHFNLISALHKSIRDSDPDAALYWLSRMLLAGEDPRYLARRLVRVASEDVGLADPDALPRTLAAWDAFERLGSPEGELAIAQATLYLALAPKSDAVYRGFGEARSAVEERPAEPVPMALRNAPTGLMKEIGYGEGYRSAHDDPGGVAGLDCLPESLAGSRFYRPGEAGFEAELRERLERLLRLRRRPR